MFCGVENHEYEYLIVYLFYDTDEMNYGYNRHVHWAYVPTLSLLLLYWLSFSKFWQTWRCFMPLVC